MATTGGAAMMDDDNAEWIEAVEAGRYHAVDLRSWKGRPECANALPMARR